MCACLHWAVLPNRPCEPQGHDNELGEDNKEGKKDEAKSAPVEAAVENVAHLSAPHVPKNVSA